MVGLKTNGLTDKIMKDEDIHRCLKEIQIEHGINTINYGPKTDLLLKLGMTIVQCDSQNRIESQIEQAMEAKKGNTKKNVEKLEKK